MQKNTPPTIRRRLLSAAATAAVVPLALTACGGGSGTAGSDPDTLTVLDYYNNEPDKSLMQAAIDDCGAEIGVSIKRETVPGQDLIQKVLQRSSSRTLPDVLMLDNPDVQEIAQSGGLTPLSDYGLDTSGFAQGILDAASYEGEVYGLGPVVNTLGLFYNVDMLEEAGIEPPQTWDELKSAAEALTEGDRYGLSFSAVATYEGSWQFLPFMWSNGGDETDLTTPQVAEALELWVDLVESGSASESVMNWSQGDAKDQFAAGNAAMTINGPWQIPALEESGINYDSVQVPVPNAGETPIAPLGGEVWTVPATGDEAKQAKAAEFVACISGEENQLEIAKATFKVPTRTDLIDEYVEEVPSMEAFAEQVRNARSRTGQLGTEWPATATEIYTAIQLALTGKATAEEAFEQAAQG
ncbi:sugar ABC transporter substrate-binding protein [Zhihengliuella halotolerans]|uniref:Carbohydrate ABC transporter substrate-binding protein (CUT1 family) n=1 Tax=Zhihengliuella halotolerans TaxID=370736 RepID=A0A4Q8ADT2_9MICC|nr:ABC transporter substrate-binding protein [Zhihengliuella halotolerans]RZU62314.1 carbohydrate ABC transporter substrate-binding protein (CUT1 family) [Zhihengliuella halotolerans]